MRSSARSGSLDDVTASLMRRSLQFGTLTAEELMTPRSKVVALQTDDTIADLVAAVAASGYSRFPVVQGIWTRPSASSMSSRCSRFRPPSARTRC